MFSKHTKLNECHINSYELKISNFTGRSKLGSQTQMLEHPKALPFRKKINSERTEIVWKPVCFVDRISGTDVNRNTCSQYLTLLKYHKSNVSV